MPSVDDTSATQDREIATEPLPEKAECAAAAPLTNPNLSATLQAEYQALRTDVQQAQDLATEFQRQLAGKSNEVTELRALFGKTRDHLIQLQLGITELRKERHTLANEAMRATGLEQKLEAAKAEQDRLRADLEAARRALVTWAEEMVRFSRGRDAEIARLSAEAERLEQQLEAAEVSPDSPATKQERRASGKRKGGKHSVSDEGSEASG